MEWTFFREIAWIFLIYGFLGWCTEVIFAAVNNGKFVNRGFLNGPICPIYGFGVLTVVKLLRPFGSNILLLFIGSVIITTILEFLTGFLLEKLFRQKWWDYSDVPFNIKGYVCLKFSLLWGLACMFIVKIIHPMVMKFIQILPNALSTVLCAVVLTATAVDFLLTLINMLKLPKTLRSITELERALNVVSENIGEKLSTKAISINTKAEARKIKNTEKLNFIHRRIINAYPNLKNGRYKEQLELLAQKHAKRAAARKAQKAAKK